MSRSIHTSVTAMAATAVAMFGALGARDQSAHAATVTLTPVTNTTPNFAGPILINGTVTIGPGETFIHPTLVSSHGMPFLSTYLAGFNGSGQQFDPGFLAWNGLGSYAGPIINHQVSANNLGYASGMPVGLYGSNIFGPGGMAFITLNYTGTNGGTVAMSATFAINVVPTPGAIALLGLGGFLAMKRRR